MNKTLGHLLGGACAGVAATVAMSVVMLGARRAGLLGEPPPRRITRQLLAPLNPRLLFGKKLDAATLAAHLGFGASAGSLFSLLPARFRSGAGGAAYGACVWAVTYAGALPRLGLMPPARNDRPGRPASMLLSHVVYGWALSRFSAR